MYKYLDVNSEANKVGVFRKNKWGYVLGGTKVGVQNCGSEPFQIQLLAFDPFEGYRYRDVKHYSIQKGGVRNRWAPELKIS